jgi:hypothetical protein
VQRHDGQCDDMNACTRRHLRQRRVHSHGEQLRRAQLGPEPR